MFTNVLDLAQKSSASTMLAYIPNINKQQGLVLELLVMIAYNIYIIYINANGFKTGVLQCDSR